MCVIQDLQPELKLMDTKLGNLRQRVGIAIERDNFTKYHGLVDEIVELQGTLLTHPTFMQLAAYRMARDASNPKFEALKTPINTSAEFKNVIEMEKRKLAEELDESVEVSIAKERVMIKKEAEVE